MKNKYVFILTLTIVCSLLLSLAAKGLEERKNKNIEIDMKKNILSAIGIDVNSFSISDIDSYFSNNIDTLVINLEGDVIEKLSIDDLIQVENKQNGEVRYLYNNQEYLPLYNETEKKVIIIPISGKGLWSSLFGYFAVDTKDYSTVKGITFYRHGETPGLGGEISATWFQENFIGKKIYSSNDSLQSITVIKGKAPENAQHHVDGISGATITSNGVTALLNRDLKRYEPYFVKNRK